MGLIDGGNILILPPWGNVMVQYSRWGDGWGFEAILNTLSFHDCGHGCLFDIHADPNERKDVSKENTGVLNDMMARLAELNKGVFLPDRGQNDPRACSAWDGFYGPFAD